MNTTEIRYASKATRLGEKLLSDVQTGKFRPGMLLPGEDELAGRYRVSRPTVRRALEMLIKGQHLEKLPHRGVLVVDKGQSRAAVGQIAFLTSSLDFEAKLHVQGLSELIDSEKYSLAVYCVEANLPRLGKMIERIAALHPAGVIMQTISPELLALDVTCFASAGLPVVTIGQHTTPGLDCDRVAISGRENGIQMARYILNHGCRDFAWISAGPREDNEDVLTHIRRELAAGGAELPEDRVFIFDAPHGYGNQPDPFVDVERGVAELLRKGFRHELLLCGHDYVAIGALRAIESAGLKVPEDIKLLSGMHVPMGNLAPRRISGFDFGHVSQGRLAAELLMRRVEGYAGPLEVHYCPAAWTPGDTA